jgi:hypothetical protein
VEERRWFRKTKQWLFSRKGDQVSIALHGSSDKDQDRQVDQIPINAVSEALSRRLNLTSRLRMQEARIQENPSKIELQYLSVPGNGEKFNKDKLIEQVRQGVPYTMNALVSRLDNSGTWHWHLEKFNLTFTGGGEVVAKASYGSEKYHLKLGANPPSEWEHVFGTVYGTVKNPGIRNRSSSMSGSNAAEQITNAPGDFYDLTITGKDPNSSIVVYTVSRRDTLKNITTKNKILEEGILKEVITHHVTPKGKFQVKVSHENATSHTSEQNYEENSNEISTFLHDLREKISSLKKVKVTSFKPDPGRRIPGLNALKEITYELNHRHHLLVTGYPPERIGTMVVYEFKPGNSESETATVRFKDRSNKGGQVKDLDTQAALNLLKDSLDLTRSVHLAKFPPSD